MICKEGMKGKGKRQTKKKGWKEGTGNEREEKGLSAWLGTKTYGWRSVGIEIIHFNISFLKQLILAQDVLPMSFGFYELEQMFF